MAVSFPVQHSMLFHSLPQEGISQMQFWSSYSLPNNLHLMWQEVQTLSMACWALCHMTFDDPPSLFSPHSPFMPPRLAHISQFPEHGTRLILCPYTSNSLCASHFSLPSLLDSLLHSSKLEVSIIVFDPPVGTGHHFYMHSLSSLPLLSLWWYLTEYLFTYVPAFQTPQPAWQSISQSRYFCSTILWDLRTVNFCASVSSSVQWGEPNHKAIRRMKQVNMCKVLKIVYGPWKAPTKDLLPMFSE